MTRRMLPALLVVTAQLAPCAARAAEPIPTKQECVSANESAQDLRRAEQLQEARTQLVLCVSARCPGPVREDCAARLSEVDAVMPSLVFVAKDRAGNDLSAVNVTMDGLPFADNLDGTAVQVDPGEHRFIFEGEGLPATEKVIVVHEGDKSRHIKVVLGPAPVDEAAQQPQGSLFSPSRRRTMGLVLGGAGALGLVVGTIMGIVAKSTYDRALKECFGNPQTCSPEGVHDGQTAHDQAGVSTASFVIGVLLLGGGAALYLTAPKTPGVALGAGVGSDGAGLRVKAVW
jgi:hypothetical protein